MSNEESNILNLQPSPDYDVSELFENDEKVVIVSVKTKCIIEKNTINYQRLTTLQGIDDIFDKNKLLNAFKIKFGCGGNVVNHKNYGEVIQLQGDHRNNISKFFNEINIIDSIRVPYETVNFRFTYFYLKTN